MQAVGYLLLEIARSWFLASFVIAFWLLVALAPPLHAVMFHSIPADGPLSVFQRLDVDRAITQSLVTGIDHPALTGVGLQTREIDHLVDVRFVYLGLAIKLIISLILLLVIRLDAAATRGALAIVGLLGLASLTAYEQLFIVFHKLFFLDGTWTFPPDHFLLTQVYPFAFFAWIWGGVIGLSLLTVSFVHLVVRKKAV